MRERGLSVDDTPVWRQVQSYAPEIKRWRAAQCSRSFHTAERTLEGVEAMHMMREGQVRRLDGRDAVGEAKFAESLFGVAV